jgi:hypothetical protein
MNDTLSVLLATTVLAVGGLGLYMYKSSDDNQKGGKYDDDYDEDNLFGSGSLWGSSNEDDEHAEHVENDYEKDYDEEIYEARAKTKSKPKASKTKRRRVGGGTKRRY